MSVPLTTVERIAPSLAAFYGIASESAAELKVAIPAIVQSYDAVKQTVTVQPAISERMRINGVVQDVVLPTIADVPILLPRAGGFSLTFPVQQGDECLLVFSDGCIDAWHQNGGQQARIAGRRHDLSDAIAILGPWSTPRQLASYSTASAQLRSDDGQTVVEVGSGEVTIKATTVTVQSTGTVNVTGQHVNVTGSQKVDIEGNAQTTIEGRNFLLHEHVIGTSTTGPVV